MSEVERLPALNFLLLVRVELRLNLGGASFVDQELQLGRHLLRQDGVGGLQLELREGGFRPIDDRDQEGSVSLGHLAGGHVLELDQPHLSSGVPHLEGGSEGLEKDI